MKKIFLLITLSTWALGVLSVRAEYALSKPAKLYVNGVENYVETFVVGGENWYKLQDIATLFVDLQPRFDYTVANGAIAIAMGKNYTPKGEALSASRPGRHPVELYSRSLTVDGRKVEALCYKIGEEYCLSERSIAQLFDCGRAKMPTPGYRGVDFMTNYKYSSEVGGLLSKAPSEVGNLSFNLGRGGFALEYRSYIYLIHNNILYRMNSDGTNLIDLKTKIAHSLNGRRDRVYFYDYGSKVSSIALHGADKRTEICPLYAIAQQEPWALTYVDDRVYCKYNNRISGKWLDEVRWYATSGRYDQVVYRIASDKRVIGDHFVDDHYLYFNVNWMNRKDIDKVGKLEDKEVLVKANVVQPFVYEGKMYFLGRDDNKMYVMEMDSKSTPRKLSDLAVNAFYIAKGKIIYLRNQAIYTTPLRSTQGKAAVKGISSLLGVDASALDATDKMLVASGVKNFNVAGDWIVYSDRSTTDYAKVGVVRIDGSKKVSMP